MGIESWSTTPASNNSAPPDGAPEGWSPSSVNATIRQQMADHRTQWESAEWFNYGYTHTYASATSFTITGDYTTLYTVGRRVKIVAATPGTIYGTITVSTYGAPNTTVTVAFDSGSLSNEALTVYLSIDSGKANNRVDLPVVDGGTGVSAMPNFHVTKFAGQGISSTSAELVSWSTETFDSNSNFASNRFTPTVPGKYQINIMLLTTSLSSSGYGSVHLYKNGASIEQSYFTVGGLGVGSGVISTVASANGSSDYFEVYADSESDSSYTIPGSVTGVSFSGHWVGP